MAVYSGSQHIVRFHSGELWCFSMDKNTGISYRRMDQSGAWAQPSVLIADAREDFSVNIDSKDHLHLICRSAKGELLYLFYSGAGWSRQILCRYEPVRYTIRYPIVIPRDNKIHILFAIGTTFDTGYWSLQHYYWDETAWHSKEIVRITAGYRLSPFMPSSLKSICIWFTVRWLPANIKYFTADIIWNMVFGVHRRMLPTAGRLQYAFHPYP